MISLFLDSGPFSSANHTEEIGGCEPVNPIILSPAKGQENLLKPTHNSKGNRYTDGSEQKYIYRQWVTMAGKMAIVRDAPTNSVHGA